MRYHSPYRDLPPHPGAHFFANVDIALPFIEQPYAKTRLPSESRSENPIKKFLSLLVASDIELLFFVLSQTG
jgi:hypothetical protein